MFVEEKQLETLASYEVEFEEFPFRAEPQTQPTV